MTRNAFDSLDGFQVGDLGRRAFGVPNPTRPGHLVDPGRSGFGSPLLLSLVAPLPCFNIGPSGDRGHREETRDECSQLSSSSRAESTS